MRNVGGLRTFNPKLKDSAGGEVNDFLMAPCHYQNQCWQLSIGPLNKLHWNMTHNWTFFFSEKIYIWKFCTTFDDFFFIKGEHGLSLVYLIDFGTEISTIYKRNQRRHSVYILYPLCAFGVTADTRLWWSTIISVHSLPVEVNNNVGGVLLNQFLPFVNFDIFRTSPKHYLRLR